MRMGAGQLPDRRAGLVRRRRDTPDLLATDIPRWFLDCQGLSKSTAEKDVSKLGGYYGPRQGKGYKVIAVGTPPEWDADMLKVGAVGVAR